MSVRVFTFAPSVPAGTTQAAPLTVNLAMPPCIVDAIEAKVPPGPRGLMGFALGAAGQAVLPYGPASWVVADDETLTWSLTDQIQSGAWQFYGYNTGQFAHAVYLRFTTSPVSVTTQGLQQLADPASISSLDGVAAAPAGA